MVWYSDIIPVAMIEMKNVRLERDGEGSQWVYPGDDVAWKRVCNIQRNACIEHMGCDKDHVMNGEDDDRIYIDFSKDFLFFRERRGSRTHGIVEVFQTNVDIVLVLKPIHMWCGVKDPKETFGCTWVCIAATPVNTQCV